LLFLLNFFLKLCDNVKCIKSADLTNYIFISFKEC
jgi:hypothetical protein